MFTWADWPLIPVREKPPVMGRHTVLNSQLIGQAVNLLMPIALLPCHSKGAIDRAANKTMSATTLARSGIA